MPGAKPLEASESEEKEECDTSDYDRDDEGGRDISMEDAYYQPQERLEGEEDEAEEHLGASQAHTADNTRDGQGGDNDSGSDNCALEPAASPTRLGSQTNGSAARIVTPEKVSSPSTASDQRHHGNGDVQDDDGDETLPKSRVTKANGKEVIELLDSDDDELPSLPPTKKSGSSHALAKRRSIPEDDDGIPLGSSSTVGIKANESVLQDTDDEGAANQESDDEKALPRGCHSASGNTKSGLALEDTDDELERSTPACTSRTCVPARPRRPRRRRQEEEEEQEDSDEEWNPDAASQDSDELPRGCKSASDQKEYGWALEDTDNEAQSADAAMSMPKRPRLRRRRQRVPEDDSDEEWNPGTSNAAACSEDEEDCSLEPIVSSGNRTTKKKDEKRALRYVYCCPVCFVECYRRLDLDIPHHQEADDDEESVNNEDEDDDQEETWNDLKLNDYEYGPVEVMAKVDPTLQMAGAFCFGRLKPLKEHLKEDHNLNIEGVKSDLYHRFHLSQADGLVQRHQRLAHDMKGLGYTSAYFDHVGEELVALRKARKQWRRWRKAGAHVGQEAAHFRAQMDIFWDSFRIRGDRIWRALQYAHREKPGQTSSEDEHINDGDEDEGEDINHDLIYRQQVNGKEEEEEDKRYLKELCKRHRIVDDEEILDTDEEEAAAEGGSDVDLQFNRFSASNKANGPLDLEDTDDEGVVDKQPVPGLNSYRTSDGTDDGEGSSDVACDGDVEALEGLESYKAGLEDLVASEPQESRQLQQDEIKFDRYMKKLINHRKFLDLPEDKVDEKLKELKKQNPANIPYHFCLVKIDAGYYCSLRFLLSQFGTPRHHPIGISTEGYFWDSQNFADLDKLLKIFKKNPQCDLAQASGEAALPLEGLPPLSPLRCGIFGTTLDKDYGLGCRTSNALQEEPLRLSQGSKRKRRRASAFEDEDDID